MSAGDPVLRIGTPESLTATATPFDLATSAPAVLRRGEKIVLAYFVYVALMLSVRLRLEHALLAWCLPVLLTVLFAAQSYYSQGWSRVLRDWAVLGLILVAYREVDWFAGASSTPWQSTWIGWDRFLLNELGLRSAIESLGGWIPSGLELVYLSLYAIPPLCMGALYWNGQRKQIDRFLTTLFLGTCCAYALLPYFPSVGPRVAFANQDLPNYSGIWRFTNVWLLDHADISTSVFPSGHVAVAFSAAFGIVRVLPYRRLLCASLLTIAVTVFVATVYCRYHYAADGLTSIAISVLAWLGSEALERNA